MAYEVEISCAVRRQYNFAMLFEQFELSSTQLVPVAGAWRIEAGEADWIRKD